MGLKLKSCNVYESFLGEATLLQLKFGSVIIYSIYLLTYISKVTIYN